MSVFIAQLLEESLESPSDVSGIHERVLDVVRQMETGEVGELVSVLKKAQEDLNEQMDFSYFKRMKEMEAENKELEEQLAIKEAEQEEEANLICSLKEENKELKEDYEGLQLTQKLTLKVVDDKQNEIEELKGQLGKS